MNNLIILLFLSLTFPAQAVIPGRRTTMDTRSAIRWVRVNAAKFHIDPEKTVAAGQSAG